jgi:hypothetical protein
VPDRVLRRLTRQSCVVILVLLAVSSVSAIFTKGSLCTHPTPGRSLTTLTSSCLSRPADPTPDRSKIYTKISGYQMKLEHNILPAACPKFHCSRQPSCEPGPVALVRHTSVWTKVKLTMVSCTAALFARFLDGTYATPTALVPSNITRDTRAFVRKYRLL